MKKIISIVSLALFIGAIVVPVLAAEKSTKVVTIVKEDPSKDKAKATAAKDENKTAAKSETKTADKKDCTTAEKKECAKKSADAKKGECSGDKTSAQK